MWILNTNYHCRIKTDTLDVNIRISEPRTSVFVPILLSARKHNNHMNQCWASCDIYIHIYRLMNNVFFSITLLENHGFIKGIDHNWWRICRAEIYGLTFKCKKEILSYNHNFHIGKHIDSLTEAKFRDNKKVD